MVVLRSAVELKSLLRLTKKKTGWSRLLCRKRNATVASRHLRWCGLRLLRVYTLSMRDEAIDATLFRLYVNTSDERR